jgi:hypothetical protein
MRLSFSPVYLTHQRDTNHRKFSHVLDLLNALAWLRWYNTLYHLKRCPSTSRDGMCSISRRSLKVAVAGGLVSRVPQEANSIEAIVYRAACDSSRVRMGGCKGAGMLSKLQTRGENIYSIAAPAGYTIS